MVCEAMTCGATTNSSDATDLNCCRAQADSPDNCTGTQLCVSDQCATCTVADDGTSDCVVTAENNFLCNNTADSPMNGACYVETCEADADCTEYTMNCNANG